MTKRTTFTYTDLADRPAFIRFLEIFPGAVTWTFLSMPIILSFFAPITVAYFIIAFDLVWLMKSLRLSYYLVQGYSQLHRDQQIDWYQRFRQLKKLDQSIAQSEEELAAWVHDHPQASSWLRWGNDARLERAEYRRLAHDRRTLKSLVAHRQLLLNPDEVYNAVIVATYNESIDILEPSIKSLTAVNYSLKQMMLVIAYEERGGAEVEANAKLLIEKYGSRFAYATAIKHPAGLPDEVIGKGGNITFAARELTKEVERQNIDPENVIVTTLDSDHRPHREYFAYLAYMYAIDPNRIHKSFQPVPMFFNNIWDVPAPMRLIATGNSFWMIMETMRPHRLRNFAAHAQGLKTLIDTDYWSKTSIVEDGHQFWRTYFTYDGNHHVVPLFIPVFQDAVLADGYMKTFKVQYLQLRRWAWGVSDFSFVVRNSIKNPQIPWSDKLVQIWRLFEGHFSWATAPLILTFVAWLPLYLNRRFADQLLAHELPIIASRIMNLALVGIFITVIISLISLPPRPERYKKTKFLTMLVQWLLLPVVAIVFSAFAAIDAQTRLMIGKYLDFRVTDKATKK